MYAPPRPPLPRPPQGRFELQLRRSRSADRGHLEARAREIAAVERLRLLERTRVSARWFARARRSLPQGVGSSFQACEPYPLYITHGKGARVWDVDGREYVDLHGGFGTMLAGHAHPEIASAIGRAALSGTHFAAPTPETVVLAELLCKRFALDQVRFCNSGTEATMHAIRVARAHTGRDHVVKVEGGYHGHHDTVLFGLAPDLDGPGTGHRPASATSSLGTPRSLSETTHVIAFNDLDALERLLARLGNDIACLILEPVMMNIGIVEPEPGYLAGIKELLHRHGALLVFDEVKTGTALAPGGAAERYGVRPDLTCLGKATFGGTPGAAFGGRAEVMAWVARGAAQQGTFNGNPLVAAAALAALTRVFTPAAYEHLERLGRRIADGCRRAIEASGLEAHVVDLGAKGCVTFRRERVRTYRDFLETSLDLDAAVYPWMLNRVILLAPGREEQWTLSVQHTEAEVDRYVEAFAELCAELVS